MIETTATPIKVSIVDDDPDIADMLAALIGGTPGFWCLRKFTRAYEAADQIPIDRPDVVLMDIQMPRMSGIECVRRLKKTLPDLKILMLTTYEDEDLLFKSLRAGAMGYLLKRTRPARILEAIEDVQRGEAPITGKLARILVQYFHRPEKNADSLSSISDREREILDGLARGLRNKEIGAKLCVSENTVRSHLRNIYEKLHVESRAEAVAKYLESGP